MASRIHAAEGCDATKADQGTEAGKQIILYPVSGIRNYLGISPNQKQKTSKHKRIYRWLAINKLRSVYLRLNRSLK